MSLILALELVAEEISLCQVGYGGRTECALADRRWGQSSLQVEFLARDET